MKIVNLEYPLNPLICAEAEPCVMALGFFDGVHLGHQNIIQTAKDIAKKKRLKLAVMTFFPHPSEVIQPENCIKSFITPPAIKQKTFENLGVEILYVVKFDLALSQLSHEDFVKNFIVNLQCKHAVAGFDFKYGFRGKGNMDELKRAGKNLFEVTKVSKVASKNEKISSTKIRDLLSVGKVEDIPTFLGKYYETVGLVDSTIKVKKVLMKDNYLLPKLGTYKIEAKVGQEYFNGFCSITQNHFEEKPIVKIFLLDCYKPLKNKEVSIKWLLYVSEVQLLQETKQLYEGVM